LGNAVLVVGFLAIGYDIRQHGFIQVPPSIILIADVGVFLDYCFILWVFKENSYAPRTIKGEETQKVIATDPYSLIRHPLYLGLLAMILLTSIAFGSWRDAHLVLLYIPIMVGVFSMRKKCC
jgi:protein-S-isoprenylcysteine O-methyltransferase Ste14